MKRTSILLLVLAAVAACQESPSAPVVEDVAQLGAMPADLAALYGVVPAMDGTDRRTAGRPPLLGLLTRRAIRTVYDEQGEAAAQAIRDEMAPLIRAVREALAARDREAAIAAREALAAYQAGLISEVLGSEPLDRIMAAVTAGIDRLTARIDAAEANGRDVTRAREALARIEGLADEAGAARDAGDDVTALVLAARAADGLFLMHRRARRGDRAGDGTNRRGG